MQIGNLTIVAGTFTQVQAAGSTTTLTRNNILGFNSTTGALSTTFIPNISGEVTALLPSADGTAVYVGGNFNTVNGTASASLAEISVSNGALRAGLPRTHDERTRQGPEAAPAAGSGSPVAHQVGDHRRAGAAAMATLNPTTGAFDLVHAGADRGRAQRWRHRGHQVRHHPGRLATRRHRQLHDRRRRHRTTRCSCSTSPVPTATVANWQTNFYTSICASVFNTYMRDLDISPDGTYFVISDHGCVRRQHQRRATRPPAGRSARPAPDLHADLDRLHRRRHDVRRRHHRHRRLRRRPHPLGEQPVRRRPAPGPGAVARAGHRGARPGQRPAASLEPDAAHARCRRLRHAGHVAAGCGSAATPTTSARGVPRQGRVPAARRRRGRPTPTAGALPANVYLAGRTGTNASSTVLYRVNAAGPTLLALDSGPDWTGDTADAPDAHHGGGSNDADWGSAVGSVDPSVPAGTPIGLFNTERWAARDALELPGHRRHATIRVNLFFANRCSCTNYAGGRVFNVAIDGTTVARRTTTSSRTSATTAGWMKSFAVTSDGSVDIDFTQRHREPARERHRDRTYRAGRAASAAVPGPLPRQRRWRPDRVARQRAGLGRRLRWHSRQPPRRGQQHRRHTPRSPT